MINKWKNKRLKSLIFLVLIFSMSVVSASASGAALNVDVVKYEPFPAEIGQYVTVWVKVENAGYSRAEDVSLEIVPAYPFSLDPNDKAIENIGILPTKIGAVVEYHLYVDETAKPGTRSIKVRYQDDEGTGWMEKEFDIRVGSDTFDSKGTLKLEQIVTEPEVLGPGDKGTVTVTLENSATQYTVNIDGKEYDTNARIQSAELSGMHDIRVTSDPFVETGILGPGDTVDLTFNIQVAENAADGTNHLELIVEGSSHSYNSKWDIPIKVDSSGIKVIPAKPLTLHNSADTLEFDVVNTHPNTLTSVSIKPRAEGIEFSPMEYFIGSMDHDEMFTIEFDATIVSDDISTPTDLTLTAQYRNGYNQHETTIDDLSLAVEFVKTNNSNGLAGIGLLLAIIAGSSLVMYWHKKQQQ